MLPLEAIVGLALVAVVVYKVLNRQRSNRCEMPDTASVWRQQRAVETRADLESLATKVQVAAARLVAALENEADLNARFNGNPGTLELLPNFIAARQEVVESQAAYDLANEEYRELAGTLPQTEDIPASVHMPEAVLAR